MIDLSPLLQAAIALLASTITLKMIRCIKARTTAQQQVLLRSAAEILVRAAEQIYGFNMGQEKLNYVEAELKRRGYWVDTATIEASVRLMNLESAWTPKPSVKAGE